MVQCWRVLLSGDLQIIVIEEDVLFNHLAEFTLNLIPTIYVIIMVVLNFYFVFSV